MDYSKWKTKEGNFIDIHDMSIEYIENCIKIIKRSKYLNVMERYDTLPEYPIRYVDYNQYKQYLKIFNNELKSRNALKR